jgi:hypothetical protein
MDENRIRKGREEARRKMAGISFDFLRAPSRPARLKALS